MRIREGAGWLLAACLVLLGGCDTPVRMTRQQAEQAAFLPPELAAAARKTSVDAASGQDRAASLAPSAAPAGNLSQTGSVKLRADQPSQQPAPAKQRKSAQRQTSTAATAAPQKEQAASRPRPARAPREAEREPEVAPRPTAARPASETEREPEALSRPSPARATRGAEREPEAAPRPDPVEASPPPPANPESQLAEATAEPVQGLEELDLRRSLDPAEQAGAAAEPVAADAVATPPMPTLPTTVGPGVKGLRPVREPRQGQGCQCPYDLTETGQKCDEGSEWSQPGGYGPVCYADTWAVAPGPECSTLSGGLSSELATGFCPPG